MKTINFNCSKEDNEFIRKIIKRIHELHPDEFNHMDISMDLTACHCNGTPLDLNKFLNFDDFNFNHDVFGISNNISRVSGELSNFFLPRCSK